MKNLSFNVKLKNKDYIFMLKRFNKVHHEDPGSKPPDSLEGKLTYLETEISRVAETRLFQYLGIGESTIAEHIKSLYAIAQQVQSKELSRIQRIFNEKIEPILTKHIKTEKLSRAGRELKTYLSSMNQEVVSSGTPQVIVDGDDFVLRYNLEPDYQFTLSIGEKTFQLKGLGRRRDGTIEASGSFGRVFFGKDPVTEKDIAVKVVRKKPNQDITALKNEAEILKKLEGKEHVLGASEVVFDGDYMFVVMDKVEGLDLFDRLRSSPPLDFRSKISILLDVAKGIKSAHDAGITHRDLKPENILIDHQGNATLIDFGLASQKTTTILSGTFKYMAPETSKRKLQGKPVDIYSFGIMMDEMLKGSHLPPLNIRNRDISISEERYLHAVVSSKTRKKLTSLGQNCLKLNPLERISIGQVISSLADILKDIDK